MSAEPKPCIFRLYKLCKPSILVKAKGLEYGSLEWIMNVCSYCIKSTYAQSHKPSKRPRPSKFSVVNTL